MKNIHAAFMLVSDQEMRTLCSRLVALKEVPENWRDFDRVMPEVTCEDCLDLVRRYGHKV
jgi:hypothetical protein